MQWHKWLPLALVLPLALLIDRLTKLWVINNLQMGETVPLLPELQPYLQLTRSFNTGIAFGLGSGGSGIFMVLSVVIIGGLLYFYYETPARAHLSHISLAMVIGGAIGNVIDRFQYGHVIDFVHVVIPGVISNVSNLADHMIVLGVVILLLDSFLQERRRTQAEQDPVTDSDSAASTVTKPTDS